MAHLGEHQRVQRRANVILFGGMGAGKSSLINLISGLDHDVARAPPSSPPFYTLDAKPYDITIQGRDFRIFETVGWDGSHLFNLSDPDFLINCISKAYRLIKYLSNTGGISLLVFCIRRGRITTDMHINYMLFHDFLCHKQVPVALVITHLEHEKNMENWWLGHHTRFAASGMHVVGHACITAKRQFTDRYQASRQKVHNLLVAHSYEMGFAQERVSWLINFFQNLLDFLGFRLRSDSLRARMRKLRESGLLEEEITTLITEINVFRPPRHIPPPRDRRNAPPFNVAAARHMTMTTTLVNDNHNPTAIANPATSASHDEAPSLGHERRFPTDLTSQITREGPDPVASGGFADIYRGMFRLYAQWQSIRVAIKAIRTYSGEGDFAKKNKRFRREVKVWLSLRHDNILPLLGTTMGFGRFPAMVCPWAENGTLTSYLKDCHAALSVVEILSLLDNIASGLQYLHSHSVVHGDLSGSNILINENGRAWITDFGLSTILTELEGSTFATSFYGRGTVRWMAPELFDSGMLEDTLEEAPSSILPTMYNDVYSFGGIMLQILSGSVPYHYYQNNMRVALAVLNRETPRRPNNKLVTDGRWSFMQRCWSIVDTTPSRPTCDEIVGFTKNELASVRGPY